MHRTTDRFKEAFNALPDKVQKVAITNFELLKKNPRHPSLHFKKIGKFWSLRIGLNYRALSIKDKSDYTWIWIGSHDNYMRILKKEK
jgi:hypothetical protein